MIFVFWSASELVNACKIGSSFGGNDRLVAG